MDLIKMGRLIKHAREMKGLTQAQLGEKIGVENNTISMYENGNRLPTSPALILLCRELELLPTELFSGKRIQNEETRREMLDLMKEDDKVKYATPDGDEDEIDLSDCLVVTMDRKGRPTDVWIPYEDEDLYTREEIYRLQEKPR